MLMALRYKEQCILKSTMMTYKYKQRNKHMKATV